MEGILVSLGFFGMVYGIVRLGIRKKERLMLIQAGLDPATFDKSEKTSLSTVKLGMLLVAVGLGILIANIIVKFGVMDRDATVFSLVFLFGGISLLVSYFLEKKQLKEQLPAENEKPEPEKVEQEEI
ncbi:MAG: hypothetical protein HXX14_17775 [Bacteroidetes bacterium]|nr:hypothetical protein [Bacteroidota bacterium]